MQNLRQRKLTIVKGFFSILFAALFMVLTKVKLTHILGTNMKFSASVFFGPTIASIIGIVPGTLSIVLAHIFGLLIGFYKIKNITSYLVFLPIMMAGIYFAKMFKGDRKMTIPAIIAILLFLAHPIGRRVWFYSAFWLVPIFVSLFKSKSDVILRFKPFKVYAYALGSAYVDHAIGSIMYLYYFNIPAHFWIEAIPLTFVERFIMAAGITISYFGVKAAMKALKEVAVSVAVVVRERGEEVVLGERQTQ